jgi:hypothetical protein
MERTLGAFWVRPLIDDAAVRELPVCEPDGYLLTGSDGLVVGRHWGSGPAVEAEHGLPALSVR